MSPSSNPIVLFVDPEPGSLAAARVFLHDAGIQTVFASGLQGATRIANTLRALAQRKPDVAIITDGTREGKAIDICGALRQLPGLAFLQYIRCVREGAEAAAADGEAVVKKPLERESLLGVVKAALARSDHDRQGAKEEMGESEHGMLGFHGFKESLKKRFSLTPGAIEAMKRVTPEHLYQLKEIFGESEWQVAQWVSEYLRVPFHHWADAREIEEGVLPEAFCAANLVAPMRTNDDTPIFVVSNPFNVALLEALDKTAWADLAPGIAVAPPEIVAPLFQGEQATRTRRRAPTTRPGAPVGASSNTGHCRSITARILNPQQRHENMKEGAGTQGKMALPPPPPVPLPPPKSRVSNAGPREAPVSVARTRDVIDSGADSDSPVLAMTNEILVDSVRARSSDIHFDPKDAETLVRIRVDGDLHQLRTTTNEQAMMVISRFKALAGLDIAERRKPQDGVVEALVDGRTLRLRLATTSTPSGESLIIRLLEPEAEPKTLVDLGMTEAQARTTMGMAARSAGLLLIVGTTGSGKSTTIHSVLSRIDGRTRSILSVEDPIEYKIAMANQQQVIERAGLTFDALLKSSMRQDPDVLFLGEIRDHSSAKTSMDFASSGHLTITTLHSANATIAIFRLERLGIQRGTLAEALLAVIAQKLMKVLCPECKSCGPITTAEAALLSPFTKEVPSVVARPVGCEKCRNTGYRGRTGVYEVVPFDPEIVDLVRSGAPVPQIREHAQRRGHYLISNHAVDKVRDLLVSPQDAHENVLVEELESKSSGGDSSTKLLVPAPVVETEQKSVLVVDDDDDTLALVEDHLRDAEYEVVLAEDAADALMQFARRKFDLALLDVCLPDLDGVKLVEIMQQKRIASTVVLMSALEEEELQKRCHGLGAQGLLRKPFQREDLLQRIENALGGRAPVGA